MGWFDGRSSTHGHSHGHHSTSHSNGYFVRRKGSPTRSKSGYSTYHSRNSAPSFFNLGRTSSGRSSPAHSVFSSFSSSSRRARPREGFVQRMVRAIKRLFRDIYRYARHHPIKVLMLVIIPLLTSGVLPKLLAMIGLRLPHGLISALGGSTGGARGGGFGAMDGGRGMSENLTSLMNIAKMFA
ncbi:hypothetical protein N7532_010432 [Penicillium argentinense]|uniref:Uncharacterized protein n=1 Tax=Penicillium argentinense TaxID=1131581 RepID=A0A9W9EPV7_9EURO|nr:uncharacterized protein N7532_010432 [Penicillium argentinense]KAJ5085661.1 hypothetical protein N7532_010432 [Penicillium argentinense]